MNVKQGEFIYHNLRFVQTGREMPEQYDVFDGDKLIGYVRLRWGLLQAHYLKNGELACDDSDVIYEVRYPDEIGSWYDDDKERARQLTEIAKLLAGWESSKREINAS